MEQDQLPQNVTSYDDHVSVKINTLIFPKEVIYSAAYVFIDKAYILFSSSSRYLIVDFYAKQVSDLMKLVMDFNNELVSYLLYKRLVELNGNLRNLILKKSLIINSGLI